MNPPTSEPLIAMLRDHSNRVTPVVLEPQKRLLPFYVTRAKFVTWVFFSMAQAPEVGVPQYIVEPRKGRLFVFIPSINLDLIGIGCCTFYENHLMINKYQ